MKLCKFVSSYIPSPETGYRVIKQARAKTMSPYWSARLFLFFFSLVYVNFWLIRRKMLVDGIWEAFTMVDYCDELWVYIVFIRKPP